jgi:hypothetical protein
VYLQNQPQFVEQASSYHLYLTEVSRLIEQGFEEEELSVLSRAIPDMFGRHKDWIPPLEQTASGRWIEPEWFTELESYLQPMLAQAFLLSTIGYRCQTMLEDD